MKYEEAVLFAAKHFDATPCNESRGWYGTKPGCTRKKKEEISVPERTTKKKGTKTETKTSAKKGRSQTGSKTKEPLIDLSEFKPYYQEYWISKGKNFIRPYEEEIQKTTDKETKKIDALRKKGKITDKGFTVRRDMLVDSVTQHVLGKMLSDLEERMPKEKALEIVRKIKIDIPNVNLKKDVMDDLVQLTRITGGKSTTLNNIIQDRDRASANESSKSIDIGKNGVGARGRSNLFHEFGHHVEFSNRDLGSASNDFIIKRSTSKEPKPLSEINPGTNYRSDEMAYEGKFISPYVGKYYGPYHEYSEVVSMGLEHFAQPETLKRLYNKDKDHFYFVLGAIT